MSKKNKTTKFNLEEAPTNIITANDVYHHYNKLNSQFKRISKEHEYSKKSNSAKCAYVTLVMKGDNYIPGAIVLAYSIRKAGTKHELVCMVSPDVSRKGRTRLSKLYDHIIEVDYIQLDDYNPGFTAGIEKYKTWMHLAFTKLKVYELYDYKKVLFLNADMIVMKSLDSLFKKPAPMGLYSSWASKKNHLQVIPENIYLSYMHRYPIRGSIFMVNPSQEASEKAKFILKHYQEFKSFKTQASPDEFVLTLLMMGNVRTLHRGYSTYMHNFKKYGLKWKDVYVLDFIGEKPWEADSANKDWEDFKLFRKLYAEATNNYSF